MKWMHAAHSLLFMTCRDAAPLISHAMDKKLAAQDRAAVYAHLAICRSCRRYRHQLTLLRRVLVVVNSSSVRTVDEPLPAQTRTRIHRALEQNDRKN